MAADTAKLIASLELKDNLTKGVNSAIASVGKLETRFSKLGQGVKTIGAGMGVALRNAAIIGVAAVGGLAAGIVQMVKDGQTAAKSQKLFANAIQSSGLISQQYVKILTDQQQAMLQLTGTDDEVVKDIQTRLITMKATGQETAALTPLIIAASRATGKSIETVTLAVGKGLQGNASALGRIGIALPKVTAATKSAALASLEQRKLALAADEAQAKAHGTLTKSEKAVWDHRKALLAAAIAQQKVTDAQKKGTAATSSYNTIFGELNKRFGNVNDALSGQLETRLGALRESLQNIREEAGMKLAPSITRLVEVISSKLVPAFGSFIDRILPAVITGIDKFTTLLENGGAEQGLRGITDALGPMVDMLKIAAEPVKAIVKAFLSLPAQVQGVLIGGFAINKLSGGLIGQGVGQIAGAVFQRGGTPANPLFVSDVAGGLGKIAPAAGGLGLVSKVFLVGEAIGLAVLVNDVRQGIADGNTQQSRAITDNMDRFLAQSPKAADIQNALSGVEAGIRMISDNPLNVLVQGDALDNLRKMRVELQQALAEAKGQRLTGNLGRTAPMGGALPRGAALDAEKSDALKSAILQRAMEAGRKPKDISAALQNTYNRNVLRAAQRQEAQAKRAADAAHATMIAVKEGDQGIIAAIRGIPAPSVSVYVTASDVSKIVNDRRRAVTNRNPRTSLIGGPQEF